MVNTNKLLRSYSGAIGIKTGFTQDAKYCLSAAATRNDMTLIAVILGSESSQIRFSEAQRLLDYGYANYEVVKIADKNEIIGNASVEKGKIPFTDLKADQKIQVLVPKGEASDISYKTSPKDGLTAPLKEGDTAGKIIVTKKDEVIAEYDLSAAIDVKKAGYKKLILQGIEKLVMG